MSSLSRPRHHSLRLRLVAAVGATAVTVLGTAIGTPPMAIATRQPHVVASIHVGGIPAGVAMNSRTHTLYVGNDVSYRVAVIAGPRRKVVTHVGAFNCCGLTPATVAVDQPRNTMYAVNIDDAHVYKTRDRRHAYSSSPALPAAPETLAVNTRMNRVYVTDSENSELLVLNGGTMQVVHKTILPANGAPGAVATDPSTGRVYVADHWNDNVTVIDGRTNKVIDTITDTGGYSGAVVDPRVHSAYVADALNGTLTVVDTRTDSVTKTIPVEGAGGVTVDPGPGTVLVSGTNGVTVVDAGRNTVTATVPVQGGSTGVAVDTRTHQAYAAFRHGVKVVTGLPR